MTQSTGVTFWRENAKVGATPPMALGRIVEVAPGVWTFSTSGVAVGSMVSDGAGGWRFTIGDLTGTGRIAAIRGDFVVY